MNVKLSLRISLWYVQRLSRYWKVVEKQKLLLSTNTIKCSIWGKSQQGTSFLEHFRNFLVLRFPKVLRCFQFWVSGNFLFHSCQAKILFKRSQILWSHCASVGNRKIFDEWVKLCSVGLEIVGGGYITHLSDFGWFKTSSG